MVYMSLMLNSLLKKVKPYHINYSKDNHLTMKLIILELIIVIEYIHSLQKWQKVSISRYHHGEAQSKYTLKITLIGVEPLEYMCGVLMLLTLLMVVTGLII